MKENKDKKKLNAKKTPHLQKQIEKIRKEK